MGRVAKLDSASAPDRNEPGSNQADVLCRSCVKNLVARIPVTFISIKIKRSYLDWLNETTFIAVVQSWPEVAK